MYNYTITGWWVIESVNKLFGSTLYYMEWESIIDKKFLHEGNLSVGVNVVEILYDMLYVAAFLWH